MIQLKQIGSLQAGRAIAALAVVVHHGANTTENFAEAVPGSALLEAGYLGVDFFFVLSGFIIYHSSQNKNISQYFSARIRRVYLPYLPVGVGIALLYSFWPHISAGARDWSWLTTLTLLPFNAETALSVAWTLKHEMLFYFVFAMLFFSGNLALGLVFWSIAIIVAAFIGVESNIPLALINLEFIFGIIVAVAYRRGWGHPAWYLAAVPPLLLWLWLGASPAYSVLVGLSFAALILPTAKLELRGHIQVPSWLLLLGAASYSIYLVHNVTISLTSRLAAGHHWSVVLSLGIISGVGAGLFYYWLVERSLLRFGAALAARLRRPKQSD